MQVIISLKCCYKYRLFHVSLRITRKTFKRDTKYKGIMSYNNNKGYKRRPQERKRERASKVMLLIKNLPANARFDK